MGECPLSGYSTDAIRDTLPEALNALVSSGGLGAPAGDPCGALPPAALAARVWTTLLAVEAHQRMTESWLVSGEEEPDETVVDRAVAWVDRLAWASADPGEARRVLAAAREAAASLALFWRQNQIRRIELSREAHVRQQHAARSEAQRVTGNLTRSMLLRHETIASFVGPDVSLRRWQLITMLFTIVIMGKAPPGQRRRAVCLAVHGEEKSLHRTWRAMGGALTAPQPLRPPPAPRSLQR